MDFLAYEEFTSKLTMLGTQLQNVVVKQRNQTVLEIVRSMMSYFDLPILFCGYALKIAAYILKLLPSKSVPKTPSRLWSERKPSPEHVQIWGSPAHMLNKDDDM